MTLLPPHPEVILDATNLSLGRCATQVAGLLMGKHLPTFAPATDRGATVRILHASLLRIPKKKWKEKVYYRHTHTPGHLREQRLEDLWRVKGPEEVLRRAVKNMLPKNSFQKQRLLRLLIERL